MAKRTGQREPRGRSKAKTTVRSDPQFGDHVKIIDSSARGYTHYRAKTLEDGSIVLVHVSPEVPVKSTNTSSDSMDLLALGKKLLGDKASNVSDELKSLRVVYDDPRKENTSEGANETIEAIIDSSEKIDEAVAWFDKTASSLESDYRLQSRRSKTAKAEFDDIHESLLKLQLRAGN